MHLFWPVWQGTSPQAHVPPFLATSALSLTRLTKLVLPGTGCGQQYTRSWGAYEIGACQHLLCLTRLQALQVLHLQTRALHTDHVPCSLRELRVHGLLETVALPSLSHLTNLTYLHLGFDVFHEPMRRSGPLNYCLPRSLRALILEPLLGNWTSGAVTFTPRDLVLDGLVVALCGARVLQFSQQLQYLSQYSRCPVSVLAYHPIHSRPSWVN
eukprot:jgi/Botrbrau1/683/Bobra.160_2s0007.1